MINEFNIYQPCRKQEITYRKERMKAQTQKDFLVLPVYESFNFVVAKLYLISAATICFSKICLFFSRQNIVK